MKCIYVAVGQASTVAEVVETLRENGALEYTTVVKTRPPPTPRRSSTWPPTREPRSARHWMNKGDAVLIVYDDLSKQAVAYREISLLCDVRRAARRTPATCSAPFPPARAFREAPTRTGAGR